MKIKARDIIPGWPRGRSTCAANRLHTLEWMVFWKTSVSGTDSFKRSFELGYETTYRQMQAAMVTEFRKGGTPVHANNQISLSLDDL